MLWSEWLDEYDVAASERVFRTLASVLPAGSVEPVWGEDWPRLVKDDASRHR
ncbi:hypothetical protein ACWCOV_22935 [Kribbella sp. NPDC002412]